MAVDDQGSIPDRRLAIKSRDEILSHATKSRGQSVERPAILSRDLIARLNRGAIYLHFDEVYRDRAI